MEKNDLFDDYLLGRMSEMDRIQFEKKLAGDKVFEEELQLHRSMARQIEEHEENHIRTYLQALGYNRNAKLKIRTIAIAALSIAAAFVFIFNFLSNNKNNHEQIAFSTEKPSYIEAYFTAPTNYLTAETRGTFANSEIETALSLYDKKEYAKARELFERLLKEDAVDYNTRFYAASTLLLLGERSESSRVFDAIEYEDGYFKSQIKFYLALIYLDSGKRSQSISKLNEVVALDSMFHIEALKILNSLESEQ